VSKAESRDLLNRVKALQEEKWQLEDRVRHLEESAGAMADELVEKSKLLQQYVQHTRTGSLVLTLRRSAGALALLNRRACIWNCLIELRPCIFSATTDLTALLLHCPCFGFDN